ncbi:hypothetical protein HCN44_005020 [Aphidius gifuensis]|uniref:Uncharacterized protein n=1 Tax=Aphidius gifuensis TaxID=684658 RepID=A0A834XV12_APHGI|nr:hypothetical protein HCN44_005020 [Aphidius gifuensis]
MELKKKASCRKNEGHTNFCLNLSKDEAEKCGVKYKIKITEFLDSINWRGPKYNDDFEAIKCEEIMNIIYNDYNATVYEINNNLDKSLNSTLEYFDQCMNKNVPNIILLNNNETQFGNFYSN